jgi:Tetratricopeptide repeat
VAQSDRPSSSRGAGGPKPGTSRPKTASGGARKPSSGKPGSSGKPYGGKPSSGKPSSGKPGSRQGGSRSGSGSRPPEREEPRTAGPKQWGSLGRKGAGRLTSPEFDARDSVGAQGRDTRPAPVDRESDRWVRVDDVRDEAAGAVRRGQKGRPPSSGSSKSSPVKERRGRDFRKAGAGSGGADAKAELVKALGTARGNKANDRLREAAYAFERERYADARTILKPIAEQAPQAASVRELLGLTYYRLGRWKDAVRELEAFREITGSAEQNPVLADAYRGLRKHTQVEELWDELRDQSPSADLVTEGRIVMAGSLADRKKLDQAIALLEKSHRATKSPQIHHLRQAYALADLYERAGDVVRARELFRWVAEREPEFADAAERASSIG